MKMNRVQFRASSAAIRQQSKHSLGTEAPSLRGKPTIKRKAESAAEALWWSMMDPMFLTYCERLEDLMRATRLPVAYGLREHVVAGGLLSYASDLARNHQYAATYVDKILKGAKRSDLPAQQSTRFELVLSLKTAKALGLNIPQPMLLHADEVIQ
jgi:ABC-type uncharacterized transport system substrate-binding protein